MKRILSLISLVPIVSLVPVNAFADIYHYNNVIIGDRAIGLGGAYAGVSDDASGVVYNPAGLAFAMGNDISGSANAYYQKKVTYKEIYPGADFEERSEGFVPSFFGGIQKLDKLTPGLVAGFAVYSPDSEIKDQNDIIDALTSGIQAFHRTVKVSASTLNMVVAAGYRVNSNFSLGMGFGFQNTVELTQEYQLSVLHWGTTPGRSGQTADGQRYVTDVTGGTYKVNASALAEHASASGSKGLLWVRSINGNYKLLARGLEPSLGMQYVLGGNLVLGLSGRATFLMQQQYDYQGDQTQYFRFYDGTLVTRAHLDATGTNSNTGRPWSNPNGFKDNAIISPVKDAKGKRRTDVYSSFSSKEPFSKWPMSIRGGAAWFASPNLLMTFDVIHSTASDEVDPNLPQLERVAITNFAGGIEYYITPSLPVRIGGFTNYDARPALEKNVVNAQLETIDYYGGSLYLSWAEASSQIGGGAVYQYGIGKANKTGTTVQQDILADSLILAFSASHQI